MIHELTERGWQGGIALQKQWLKPCTRVRSGDSVAEVFPMKSPPILSADKSTHSDRPAHTCRWEGILNMATVTFEKATRIYPGNDKPSVDQLELEIKDGEFLVRRQIGRASCRERV